MATFVSLKLDVATRCHDPTKLELDDTAYGLLVNQAVDDLAAEQVLSPLAEDESTILVALTFQYPVPVGFAYVKELRLESAAASGSYPQSIHPGLWRLTIDSAVQPIIQFDPDGFTITAGLHVKIIGQKRVATLTGTDTAIPGLESFIRERAIAYAADILAGGVSELAAWRRTLAADCRQTSSLMLQRTPREYRPAPDSQLVPLR